MFIVIVLTLQELRHHLHTVGDIYHQSIKTILHCALAPPYAATIMQLQPTPAVFVYGGLRAIMMSPDI